MDTSERVEPAEEVESRARDMFARVVRPQFGSTSSDRFPIWVVIRYLRLRTSAELIVALDDDDDEDDNDEDEDADEADEEEDDETELGDVTALPLGDWFDIAFV